MKTETLYKSFLVATSKPFEKTVRSYAIQFKPHGYWADDYIRVCRTDGKVSWSCSGRDKKEEPNDLIATQCFVLALEAAIEESKSILGMSSAEEPEEEIKTHLKNVVNGSFFGDSTGYFHCDANKMRDAKEYLNSL